MSETTGWTTKRTSGWTHERVIRLSSILGGCVGHRLELPVFLHRLTTRVRESRRRTSYPPRGCESCDSPHSLHPNTWPHPHPTPRLVSRPGPSHSGQSVGLSERTLSGLRVLWTVSFTPVPWSLVSSEGVPGSRPNHSPQSRKGSGGFSW